VSVDAGKQTIGVSFINDYYEQAKNQDRNLIVHSVEVVGPINAAAPDLPQSHKRLITRMPAPGEERAVAKEILGKFAKRAYRRPVTDAEVEKLVGFVDLALKNGGNFLEGIQAAVQASLPMLILMPDSCSTSRVKRSAPFSPSKNVTADIPMTR